ncbi:hypothetical protein [Rubripirellula tenax]|uniref:hypothetical protein n=1 Tax=Rubripirellula tenax TaxID=2528015 RepID=UPI0011B50EB3|nr:hypothetical protein [Rubripirellula tenax]
MTPLLFVCLTLSFSLAVASAMVWQLRRQRRGLQSILERLVRKEFHHADQDDVDVGADRDR